MPGRMATKTNNDEFRSIRLQYGKYIHSKNKETLADQKVNSEQNKPLSYWSLSMTY